MAPVYVKGGAWSNVEDEILKAAVSKYGLNQWSRVSSLLTKKSAKQAKARWNEWINPTINKSEWTREDDEKLLNVVKLLPNQWRSIAPIVGRTATDCIERYQKLLEDEMSGDEDVDLKFSGPGIESAPGFGTVINDMNLHPEGRPAKPDDEEISDDDREMLFEAKARLVNTKGKRAKRKEREKMLEETKRISLLQKRRELKAAGIKVSLKSKNKKKAKEMDYSADIPFEVTPMKGLYDVEEEEFVNEKDTKNFEKGVIKTGLELEKKKEKEASKNKDNDKNDKKRQVKSLEGEEEVYEQERKKVKLVMPDVYSIDKFDENDLTGVFQNSNDTVEDIDDRISKVMKDIQVQQARGSSLKTDDIGSSSSSTITTTGTTTTTATMKPKNIGKAIRSILKDVFLELPSAKNQFQVLPKFDEEEEDIKLIKESDLVEEKERLKNLEILRQVEDEKSKLRRSQVIQRGLRVPHPSKLKKLDLTNISTLDAKIADEFQKLIKSDYKKYIDSNFIGEEIDDLDEDIYDKVHRDINGIIQNEDSKQLPKNIKIDVKLDYPKPVIAKALANINFRVSELTAKYNELHPVDNNHNKIFKDCKKLIKELIQLKVYQNIAKMEEIAINNRTNKLNSFVDNIIKQESKLTEYLRSQRNS